MKNVGFFSKKKKKKKFEIEKIYQDGAGINNCYLFFFFGLLYVKYFLYH